MMNRRCGYSDKMENGKVFLMSDYHVCYLLSVAVNQLVAQHLLPELKVICKTFDS